MSTRIKIKDKEFETFLPEDKLTNRVKELGKEITDDLLDKSPLFIVVLNGAMFFGAELFLNVDIPTAEITTTRLKSYAGTQSTGKIKTIMPLQEDIAGRTVVIVEDIVDSGTTIQRIIQQVKDLGAAEVYTAILLFKKEACKIKDLHLDYVGFEVPDKFVVGHGFDYDEQGRNLRDIYALVEGSR